MFKQIRCVQPLVLKVNSVTLAVLAPVFVMFSRYSDGNLTRFFKKKSKLPPFDP